MKQFSWKQQALALLLGCLGVLGFQASQSVSFGDRSEALIPSVEGMSESEQSRPAVAAKTLDSSRGQILGAGLLRPTINGVQGTVLDDLGQPVDGASVTLLTARDAISLNRSVLDGRASVESNSAGRFAFEDPAHEAFFLIVRHAAWSEHVEGPLYPSHGRDEEVQIVLSPGWRLVGRVIDSTGQGVAGASLGLLKSPDRVLAGDMARGGPPHDLRHSFSADESGNFESPPLPRESFDLHITSAVGVLYQPGLVPSDDPVTFEVSAGRRIQGEVLDASTGATIAGATVAVREMASSSVVSDAQGKVTLVTPPGDWSLSVLSDGHLPGILVPESVMSDFIIELIPRARVSGVVLDTTGAPIAGARIGLEGLGTRSDDSSFFALSDSEGKFDYLPPVLGSDLVIRAEHPIWGSAQLDPMSLESGEYRQGLVFRLDVGGNLTGRVWEGHGKPIQRGEVLAYSTNQGVAGIMAGEKFRTEIATDGSFSLDVGPGTWILTVQSEGYAPETITAHVRAGASPTFLDITLSSGLSLVAYVVDESGRAVSGVDVARGNLAEMDIQRTDAKGRVEFTGVGSGQQVVSAKVPGYAIAAVTCSAKSATPIVITLEPSTAISGQVLDEESGSPIPFFTVALRPKQGIGGNVGALANLVPRSFSSELGLFRLEDLPAASYDVIVNARGYCEWSSSVDTTSDGKNAQVLVHLTKGASVFGTILSRDGSNPVSGVHVSILKAGMVPTQKDLANKKRLSVRSDSVGRYRIDGIEPGTYKLAFKRAGFAFERHTVSLVNGEQREFEATLADGYSVNGRVVLESGGSREGAWILAQSIRSNGAWAGVQAIADAEGHFTLEGLEHGIHYRVTSGFFESGPRGELTSESEFDGPIKELVLLLAQKEQE